MRFEIFRRAFADQVKPLLKGWGIAAALCSLALAGLGALLLRPGADGRREGFFDFLQAVTGQTPQPLDPAAWYNLAGFGLSLPLLLGVFGAWVGSQLVAREEENGRLALLLAYPVSRGRILLEKYAALPAGLAILSGILWAALAVSSLAAGFRLPAGGLALACLNTALLALAFGTAAFALGALTGSTRKSRWLTLVAALVFCLLYRLPALLPQAAFLQLLSPLTYALRPPPAGALITGSPWAALALTLALALASWRGFERRDLEI